MAEIKNNPKGGANNLNEFNKYLDNNVDVLKQKFDEFFGEPFQFAQLTNTEQIQFALKFIYDVFNFGKYQANPSLNKTLKSSLTINIKSFVSSYQMEYQTFTSETAIKLLKYCIEHNQMFAVHYDKKNPQKKIDEEVTQKKQQSQQQKQEQKQQPSQAEEIRTQENQQKKEESKNQNLIIQTKNSRINKKNQPIQKVTPEELVNKNEFLPQQFAQKVENTELIKKHLKGVFQFYCKQQQNLSPTSTFDIINHKCKTMNIGKFMAFALASSIIVHVKDKSYSEVKIDKTIIVETFKKIAEGQKEIGFTKFLAIMEQLKKLDPSIYNRLGVGFQGPKGQNRLLEKLKYLTLPFSTRDPDGRQIIPHNRVFVPKLTTHSGKNEADLRIQLNSRKERGKFEPTDKSRLMSGPNKFTPIQDQTRFTLKLGASNGRIEKQDLSFLSKLIKQEENDQLFLKEYQLPTKKLDNLQGFDQNNRKSMQRGRYNDDNGNQFISKSGALTSRKTKKQDFVLPSISRKGIQTQIQNQRHSVGLTKRFGDRSILN